MKKFALLALLLGILFLTFSCKQVEVPGGKYTGDATVKWAGVRFSSYGMRQAYGKENFPTVAKATGFASKMQGFYEGSEGAYILIVGTMSGEDTCQLEFPLSTSISHAKGRDYDLYEDYLTAFDKAGYSVWLQVEPGDASLTKLATEVMSHYKHHSCVKGFGIDVEWYKAKDTDGEGTKLTASVANNVLKAVRAVNKDYTVFVKHWDYNWLPPATDGFIYVNDSQQFESLDHVQEEFADWAAHFAPCPVMFQIGYRADKALWNSFSNPAEDFGKFIVKGLKTKNDVGIIWVDFTLNQVLPDGDFPQPDGEASDASVKWAGIRFSYYGMKEAFTKVPNANTTAGYVNTIKGKFKDSTGACLLIVGTVDDSLTKCQLQFPLSKEITNATGESKDKYDEYLTALDSAGASVWLQVEPGNADLAELATEVLTRYKSHSCVKGFGIDVEWYKPVGTDGYGTKLNDTTALIVLNAVKAVKSDYTLFVKHWNRKWLPSSTEGMIYVNDSQRFHGLEDMQEEFAKWASRYDPNPVMFQVGYSADEELWSTFSDPAKELGEFIVSGLETDNDIGIIWVDFTLNEVL